MQINSFTPPVQRKASSPSRRAEGETLSQAREWDRTKMHYVRLGLDHRCAAQAAYGHQLGFAQVMDPCAACLKIIAGFPTPRSGQWRSNARRRTREFSDSLTIQSPTTSKGGGL